MKKCFEMKRKINKIKFHNHNRQYFRRMLQLIKNKFINQQKLKSILLKSHNKNQQPKIYQIKSKLSKDHCKETINFHQCVLLLLFNNKKDQSFSIVKNIYNSNRIKYLIFQQERKYLILKCLLKFHKKSNRIFHNHFKKKLKRSL